mmetsp:Transcript_21145/g.66196  ORF Transcript_21145/g.66196 Transcript_21145/m.66196 type:complete len:217 (+) Transcript_21145:449-1099(+)
MQVHLPVAPARRQPLRRPQQPPAEPLAAQCRHDGQVGHIRHPLPRRPRRVERPHIAGHPAIPRLDGHLDHADHGTALDRTEHQRALRRRRVCARRLQPPAAPRLRLQPQQQPREGLEASVNPCERRAEQLHLLVRELGGGKGERVLVEAVHQHIDRRGQIALLSQAEPHRPDRLARAGLRKGWFEIGDEDDTARRARAGRTAARLQRARAAVWQQR